MTRTGRALARTSSGALALSGLAGVVVPDRVAAALGLGEIGGRGRVEVRAGLGATYVALATWALLSDEPLAHRAVGVTWLGAGVARAVGSLVDDPDTDVVHWGSLVLELGGGLAAVLGSRRVPL